LFANVLLYKFDTVKIYKVSWKRERFKGSGKSKEVYEKCNKDRVQNDERHYAGN